MIRTRQYCPIILRYLLLICLCLPLLTSCESQRVIVNALPDERDANEILVFLSSKGINATKQPSAAATGGGGGSKQQVLWNISVSNDDALNAMSYLNQAGLPRKRSQSLLNIFTGAGLVPSEMEQKIRYQAGLAEQIGSTIRKMDGILDAEVQISFPEEDVLNPGKKKNPITASVFIKHNGVLEDPNSHMMTKIKRLVAASVPNLDFANVTVVGERARYNDSSDVNSGSNSENMSYVTVWSVVVAKDSLSRFRTIFFSFTLLVLFLSTSLIWMSWKIYPHIKEQGFRNFLHPKPFDVEKKAPLKEEETTEVKSDDESADEGNPGNKPE